jgi:DNA-binding transcriptional regulator LsrR (DeoR family)
MRREISALGVLGASNGHTVAKYADRITVQVNKKWVTPLSLLGGIVYADYISKRLNSGNKHKNIDCE